MSDAWGTVNDALDRLRAVHGRLPEYDAIERCTAHMASTLRQQRAALRAARAAVAHGLELADDGADCAGGVSAKQVKVNEAGVVDVAR